MEIPPRVYVETWGCQMNLHQSEGIHGVLLRAGYTIVERMGDADVVLFNTCLVRQKAEEKVYGRIGAVHKLKDSRAILLGIGGCLSQVKGRRLLERFPAVDFVFGTSGHDSLPELINAARHGDDGLSVLSPPDREIDEIPHHRSRCNTAMITITEGCSNFCSYCIVPFARGPMRSRPPERIFSEIRQAVDAGHPEILLLGQNVDSYGFDRPEFGGFPELLERIAAIGPYRIRFTSSHPRDITPAVLEVIAAHPQICNHIHLACQSGSDRILASMNRGYTRKRFLETVHASRAIIPGINLTTDLIVGFPGETDDDFADSLRLLEEAQFGSVFVAAFSPRPGTRAATMPNPVPVDVRRRRLHQVLDLQRQIAIDANRALIGKSVDVLIEGTTKEGFSYGRCDDHRTVILNQHGTVGQLVTAVVSGATAAALKGTALASIAAGANAPKGTR
ncbi:tRNA (N6-isopentenyl adenosine(37)-C2)-methylthiotransferase MiaB [Candidatus Bipolaricaulota bacterium]|nr:tRNA (N6-isopentenyl adenosine(37)-C2)-methylthiotransferase MiaB [Candidatus Bipolaricaulota bacterium]